MAAGTAIPKSAQVGRRGKPDLKAAAAEIAAQNEPETPAPPVKPAPKSKTPEPVAQVFNGSATELPISQIATDRNPRVMQSAAEQRSLNESVKLHGVLQPIRVRLGADGKYVLIAGARRLAAAKSAKLLTIPAVVAVASDTDAYVQSLVENLQREDLNPLDEAKALQTLIAETGKTQDAIGKEIGRSQSYVANSLRLLDLEDSVKEAIEAGKLTASHGKALASLPPERQAAVAKQAIEQKLPSKEVEDTIRKAKDDQKRADEMSAREIAQQTSAMAKLTAFVADKGLEAGSLTIVVDRYGDDHVIRAFQTIGAKSRAETSDDRKPAGRWPCEEQATTFRYNDWTHDGRDQFEALCTDEKHFAAFAKERDAEKVRLAKEATKKLDHARAAIAKSLRGESGDGKGLLNGDGQRVALYELLAQRDPYGAGGNRADAFVRRVRKDDAPKESLVTTITKFDLWTAVETLDDEALGKELATMLASLVQPNVWQETADHGWTDAWAVRQSLVEQRGLEADIVFGVQDVRFDTIDQMVRRGTPLSAALQKVYDERLAERAKFAMPTARRGDEAAPVVVAADQPSPETDDEGDGSDEDGDGDDDTDE